MQRHEFLQSRVLEELKVAPEGLSKLVLMAEIHGYRHAHHKLMRFSVQERAYKQAGQTEKAAQLLKTVLDEADAYYRTHAQKFEDREVKRRKRQARLKVYVLVEPDEEVVIRPAEKRLVSGNPDYSPDDWEKIMTGTADARFSYHQILNKMSVLHSVAGTHHPTRGALAMSAAMGALNPAMRLKLISEGVLSEDFLPDVLRPPVYETIPEQREPSLYTLLKNELEGKLERYPKVVWQKIDTECTLRDDEKIERQIWGQRQATNRAVDALVQSGKVVEQGERMNALYFLADDSGA